MYQNEIAKLELCESWVTKLEFGNQATEKTEIHGGEILKIKTYCVRYAF